MPVNIISRKFWNQLTNGKTFGTSTGDYTTFLQGSICEKIRTETTIDVYWKSQSQLYVDEWIVTGIVSPMTVTRVVGSFLDDEFNIGDTIYFDAWFGASQYTGTGTITSCNDLSIIFTVATGSLSSGSPDVMTIFGTTSLTAVIFKYNLIENSEADTFLSKIDGNTLSYAGSGLTGTDTTLTSQGTLLSWKDGGTVKVKTGTSGVTGYQRFIITHDFWVTPFYLPTQYDDLQNGIAPSYLKDVCSLKYIANYELRQSLYNPNITHGGIDSQMLGDVSWFDEHFNGFIPIEFTKESIAYSVSGTTVTELQPNSITHVIIEINSVNNLFSSGNTNFIVNLFKLPINDSEYKNTLTDMFDNFVFEQCFQTIGSGAVSGDYGIFTNVVGSIVTNRLHIEFDVTFTTAQKLLIAERQYIISVITDDYTQPHATSKEVNVLCDYNDFLNSIDNPNLLSLDYCKFWEHPFNSTVTGTGTKDFRGWITDGVKNETEFTLSAGATLNYLKFKIRAKNSVTLDEFDVMLYDFDLSGYPVIGGQRVVSINTTRGFKLVTASLNNLVSFANTGTTNQYLLKFALKLRWEDWIELLSADQDFYNATLLNNGLSQKWSNYSDAVANWTLEILQIATVEDPLTGTTTDFNIVSDLKSHNFAEDGNTPPLWTVALETFEGAVSLGTGNNAKYSLTQDTLVVATFTSSGALTTGALYGLIYIEQYQQGGIYNQWQLSTEELPASNNWLKPVTGQTKAKLTILGANQLKVEAMIDYTKAFGDISIAARIGYNCVDVAEVRATSFCFANWDFILNMRFFDLIIDGTTIVSMYPVSAPYTMTEIINDLFVASSGYTFSNIPFPTITYPLGRHWIFAAPVGQGSSANGRVIELVLYTSTGAWLINGIFSAMTGGVDAYGCPRLIVPTTRKLLETGSYKLLETGDFRNLENY